MEKITTKQAFSLLTLINKMNLRNNLMEMIKQQTKVENRKQATLNRIYKDKVELYKSLLDSDDMLNKLNISMGSKLQELYTKANGDEEINEELVSKLFLENIDIYNEYKELENKHSYELYNNKTILDELLDDEEYKQLEELQNECGMEFIFDIVESLPSAEKEFYKAAASIFDTTVKDIEDRNVLEVIGDIVNIFKSESFLGFFKSMSK